MAQIPSWQRDVLRQSAVDLPPNVPSMIITEVFSTYVAPPAVTAGQIEIDIHTVPGLEVTGMRPTLNHISRDFVADNARQLVASAAVAGAPAVPVPHQGEAQTAGPHPDQDLGGTWLRQRYFLQYKRTSWLFKYQGSHELTSLICD